MQMRLCIISLFFCCALIQASSEKEIEQEVISEFQIRAQKYREKSKQWYTENRWIKQAAVLKILQQGLSSEEKKALVVFAKPIDDDNLKEF